MAPRMVQLMFSYLLNNMYYIKLNNRFSKS